jgi:hypothetical protein
VGQVKTITGGWPLARVQAHQGKNSGANRKMQSFYLFIIYLLTLQSYKKYNND